MMECFRHCCDCFSKNSCRRNRKSKLTEQCVRLPYIALMKKKFIDDIKMVSYSGPKVLIVTKSHEVYGFGLLPGSEMYANNFEPRPIHQLDKKKLKKFVFGENFVVALTKGGEVFSWGKNQHGQLGLGRKPRIYEPAVISSLTGKKVIDVACGSTHAIVLCSNHEAFSLGKYSDENTKHPQLVSTNATAIASSAEAIFYSTSDRKVYGIGCLRIENSFIYYTAQNQNGQTYSIIWEEIHEFNDNIKKMVCGKDHVMVLLDDGTMYVWGDEHNGQSTQNLTTPTKFTKISQKVVDIAANWQCNLSAAMTASSRIYVWGGHQGGNFSEPVSTLFGCFEEVFTNLAQPNMTLDFISSEKSCRNECVRSGVLESIFNVEKHSDLMINVKGECIYVHKAILEAKSQYFQNMLTNNSRGNKIKVLKIEGYSYESVKEFFSYLYSGNVNITSTNVFELMNMAIRYSDENLAELIEKETETGSLSGEVMVALKEILKLSSSNYDELCEGMKKMMTGPTLEQLS